MASSAHAVFRVCAHLCVPAGSVLAGALAAALTRSRRDEVGSAHRRALAAHIATLFCVQFTRTLYLFDGLPCPDAVPVQNYIELSAHCWLHTICINFALSFRSNHNARDSYVNFLFGLAYAWCTPLVLLITLERHLEGKWLAFPELLYDIKTCFFEQDTIILGKKRDVSMQLAILRGISVFITSSFFIHLSYKIGYKKKRAVLCQEDGDSITDVNARQSQAMKYILTMMATGATEVSLDVVAWFFAFRYSAGTLAEQGLALPTRMPSADGYEGYLLAEWITLSVSLSVDFVRALIVLELMWWGGPGGRDDGQSEAAREDALPPYELATQMPRPAPASLRAMAVTPPPPSYASVVGQRGRRAEDETALLDTPPSSPSSPSPSSASSASPLPLPLPLPLPSPSLKRTPLNV